MQIFCSSLAKEGITDETLSENTPTDLRQALGVGRMPSDRNEGGSVCGQKIRLRANLHRAGGCGFPAMTVVVQFFSHRHQASVLARNFDLRRRAVTSGWSATRK